MALDEEALVMSEHVFAMEDEMMPMSGVDYSQGSQQTEAPLPVRGEVSGSSVGVVGGRGGVHPDWKAVYHVTRQRPA